MKHFEFSGVIELFPQDGGWHYVKIPKKYTKDIGTGDRGLTPITVEVVNQRWDTSVLPFGDGSKFIVLKKSVRDAEKLKLNDKIKVKFKLR